MQSEMTILVCGGREYPATITRYLGRGEYDRMGEVLPADELHVIDYGQKVGVTRTYIHYPEAEAFGDNCIEEIKRIAVKVCLESGISTG